MRENSPDSLLMSSADRRLEAEKYAVNEGTVGNLCISLNKPLRVNHVRDMPKERENADQVAAISFSFERFSCYNSLITRML